jgi:hypothetical protein
VLSSADGNKVAAVGDRFNDEHFAVQAMTSADAGASWGAAQTLSTMVQKGIREGNQLR